MKTLYHISDAQSFGVITKHGDDYVAARKAALNHARLKHRWVNIVQTVITETNVGEQRESEVIATIVVERFGNELDFAEVPARLHTVKPLPIYNGNLRGHHTVRSEE